MVPDSMAGEVIEARDGVVVGLRKRAASGTLQRETCFDGASKGFDGGLLDGLLVGRLFIM